MDIEIFKIIGDWYHCAILELTYLSDFKAEPNWIAKKLGIGYLEAKLALERLISLGLLVKENGNYTVTWNGLNKNGNKIQKKPTSLFRNLTGKVAAGKIEILKTIFRTCNHNGRWPEVYHLQAYNNLSST